MSSTFLSMFPWMFFHCTISAVEITQKNLSFLASFLLFLDDINLEIERIYRIAQSLNLLVIDAYTIDHPEQLESSCLAPIVVALKIASPKVSEATHDFPKLAIYFVV